MGSPAIVSVALGVRRVLEQTQAADERYRNVIALVEPGIGGARFSIGYADFRGNLGTGWTVRGSALRRWRDANTNYLGIEVSGHMLAMGPRLGLFRSIGTDAKREVRFTADFSIGH